MRRQTGWTLIELMLVTTLIAVLGAVAAPALGDAIARQRVLGAGNEFVGALHYARAAAVSAGARVIVCPSTDGTRCAPDTRWDGGWLMAVDRDRDDQPDAAPLLRGGGDAGLRIVSTRGRTRLAFQPSGGAAGSNVTFTLCQAGRADTTRQLVMSNSGRLRNAVVNAASAAACAAL